MRDNYIMVAEAEAKALVYTAHQCVLPRAFAYTNTLGTNSSKTAIKKYVERFSSTLDLVL